MRVRKGWCAIGSRRRATRVHTEVDDERELGAALFRGAEARLKSPRAHGRRDAADAIFESPAPADAWLRDVLRDELVKSRIPSKCQLFKITARPHTLAPRTIYTTEYDYRVQIPGITHPYPCPVCTGTYRPPKSCTL